MDDEVKHKEEHRKKVPTVLGYPFSVFFILGNEFCERFSFYGMKAVLTLYFTQRLGWSGDDATAMYHGFNMLCYLTPLFGAILADSWLGKYLTILTISVLYASGNVVMALTSIEASVIGAIIGLSIIGVGTGGIKPCVVAFGGDQFTPEQAEKQSKFFSVFYFSINAGSLVSTFITPILRSIGCFGQDTCYFAAFGIPAVLMVVALVFFIIGTPWYHRSRPTGNIMLKVIKCIGCAISNRGYNPNAKHWLDHAAKNPDYDQSFIDEVKAVLRVLKLYLPLPVFWALFDQQGSRWTLQATQMDYDIGFMRLQPDQVQAVNPALILILIPVFDYAVYPLFGLFNHCTLKRHILQRMVWGMVLASGAFAVSGFVQLSIQPTQPIPYSGSQSGVQLINLGSEELQVNITLPKVDEKTFNVKPLSGNAVQDLSNAFNQNVTFDMHQGTQEVQHTVLLNRHGSAVVFYSGPSGEPLVGDYLLYFDEERDSRKPARGQTDVIIFNAMHFPEYPPNVTIIFKLTLQSDRDVVYEFDLSNNGSVNRYTEYTNIQTNNYDGELIVNGTKQAISKQTFDFKNGEILALGFVRSKLNSTITVVAIEEAPPNSVSLLWQIPQYVIITCGEVMFSISGVAFSYSQAPASMKSVMQSAWLMTITGGNLIVLIISSAKLFSDQAVEFFAFGGLSLLSALIFCLLAIFYVYLDDDSGQADAIPEKKQEPDNGHANTETPNGYGSFIQKPISPHAKDNLAYEEATEF